MEEGEFTINKYGINAKIKSTTTIIASSNPFGKSNWNDDEKIDSLYKITIYEGSNEQYTSSRTPECSSSIVRHLDVG